MLALRDFYSRLINSRFFTLVAVSTLVAVALMTGAATDAAKAQSLLPAGCTGSLETGSGSCTFPGVGTTSCSFSSSAGAITSTCALPGGGTASCSTSITTTQASTSCTGLPGLGTLTTTVNVNGTVTFSDRCGTVTTTATGLTGNVLAPLLSCVGQGQAALALQSALPSVARAASQAGMTVVQGQIASIRDEIQRRQGAPQSAPTGQPLAFADPLDQAYGSTRSSRAPLFAKAPAAAPTSNEYGLAVWGQGFGDYEGRSGAFNGMDIGRITRTWGFIGGIDKTFTSLGSANDALVLGLLSGDTSAGVDTALGNSAHISGPSVGAYGVYVNGGFSTDLTFKADFFGVDQTQIGGATTSFGVDNYTIAFNLNNKYTLNSAWWVEPTVGFLHTNTLWNDAAHNLGMTDGDSWRVQGGARLGWSSLWNTMRVDGTLTALAYDDVSIRGGTIATITAPLVPTDEGKVFGQLIGKLNFDHGNGLSSYVESEVRGRDGVFGAGGRIGLRYRW
jgi:hypothetical protein